MPELPEVEVICQGLRPHLLGRTILSLRSSGKDLRHPLDLERMENEVVGATISGIRRRAKYLIIELENGGALIFHLGMTGNLGIFAKETPDRLHDHLFLLLDNGRELRFNDTRRFGSARHLSAAGAANMEESFFKATGPEPLDGSCRPEYLLALARRRSITIKQFLMDSRVIAGIGNIYANESLYEAAIHPQRMASSLSLEEWSRLLASVRRILEHAISCGGSTISDFVNASGEGGYFQMNFKVYGKEGEPCPVCGKTIVKQQLGGRATFFCPTCQEGV